MSTPSDDISKANDYAIEALKQLLTIASATLVLTITFLNDITGGTSGTRYLWSIVTSWLLLLTTIVLAWLAIVNAAGFLSTSPQVYLFGKNSSDRAPRDCAVWAQIFFITALLFLGFFAVMNFGGTVMPTSNNPVPTVPVITDTTSAESGETVLITATQTLTP